MGDVLVHALANYCGDWLVRNRGRFSGRRVWEEEFLGVCSVRVGRAVTAVGDVDVVVQLGVEGWVWGCSVELCGDGSLVRELCGRVELCDPGLLGWLDWLLGHMRDGGG